MFEARGTQDGDPFADVVAGLPADVEWAGYDPEYEEWLETVLAGSDSPAAGDLDLDAAVAEYEVWLRREAACLEWLALDDEPADLGSAPVRVPVLGGSANWTLDSLGELAQDCLDELAHDGLGELAHDGTTGPTHSGTAELAHDGVAGPAHDGAADPAQEHAAGSAQDGAEERLADSAVLDADLDDEALLGALQDARRAIAAAQARQAVLITELAHRRAKDAVTELTGRKAKGKQALTIGARALGEEVALELCLSKITAGSLVDTCVGLCTEAPDTLDHLARGEIDWDKAVAIVNLTQTLMHAQVNANPDLDPEDQLDPEELAKALEEEMLKKAGTEPVANLRRRAAQAMIDVNTRAAEHRHRIRRSHREFWFSADEDSMCRIGAYLPADVGMRVKHAITRLAYHARMLGGTGDKRTLDQLRVDAMADALISAADNLHPTDEHPNPAPGTGTGTGTGTPDGTTSARRDTKTTTGKDKNTDPADTRAADTRSAGTSSADTSSGDARSADTSSSGTCPDDPPSDESRPQDEGLIPDDESTLDDELATTDPRPDTDTDADTRITTEAGAGAGRENVATAAENTPAASATPTPAPAPAPAPGHGPGRGPGPGPGRGRSCSDPRVIVTIAASTLTGADNHPGYLHGFGPIVASMARDVAATGTWRCAITDNIHGTLLGLGTSTYTPKYKPTAALRRYLITRDRVCRVAGCNTPAEISDVDHRIPWPGGSTCECCTECLCGSHHRMKHETGFTLSPSTNPNDPPGTLYWTTPAGHPFPSYPAQLDPHPPGNPETPTNTTPPSGSPDPDASRSEPTDPKPTDLKSTAPEPTDSSPTDSSPTDPEPADPEPADPEPADREPADREPADRERVGPNDSSLCPACTDADVNITSEAAATQAFEEELHRARETSTSATGQSNPRPATGHPHSYDMHDGDDVTPDDVRYDTPADHRNNLHLHHPENTAYLNALRAARDSRMARLFPAHNPPPHTAPPSPHHATPPTDSTAPPQRWRSSLHCSRSTLDAIAAYAEFDRTYDGPPPF